MLAVDQGAGDPTAQRRRAQREVDPHAVPAREAEQAQEGTTLRCFPRTTTPRKPTVLPVRAPTRVSTGRTDGLIPRPRCAPSTDAMDRGTEAAGALLGRRRSGVLHGRGSSPLHGPVEPVGVPAVPGTRTRAVPRARRRAGPRTGRGLDRLRSAGHLKAGSALRPSAAPGRGPPIAPRRCVASRASRRTWPGRLPRGPRPGRGPAVPSPVRRWRRRSPSSPRRGRGSRAR